MFLEDDYMMDYKPRSKVVLEELCEIGSVGVGNTSMKCLTRLLHFCDL